MEVQLKNNNENQATKRICHATHATFDNAELNTRSPCGAPCLDRQESPVVLRTRSRPPPRFYESSPFITTHVITVPLTCTFDHMGLVLEADPMSRRNLIVDVLALSSVSHTDWEHDFQFRTIVIVDKTPVFLVSYAHRVMYPVNVVSRDMVMFTVTEYNLDPSSQLSPLPPIVLDQLWDVHQVLHCLVMSDPVLLITSKNISTMASGTTYTCRTCLKGPHRDAWIEAEFSQLDNHHSYGMYDPPLIRSGVPHSIKVVHPIWQYSQKGNGTFKARKCMNGKHLVCTGIIFEHIYAACMEHHCLRMSVAISANLGFLIEDGDVVNAYAHADAERPIIFLIVDEVFHSGYKARLFIYLSLGSCAPPLKAMEGHPYAVNW
jgi:hypothetical protein